MARKWTAHEDRIIRAAVVEGTNKDAHAALHEAGYTDRSISATQKRRWDMPSEEQATEPTELLQSYEETGETAFAQALCEVNSLEALLAIMDVDLDVWEVERWQGNKWGPVMLGADGEGGKPQFQVKAWFKRKHADPRVTAVERIVELVSGHVPTYETVPRTELSGERYMQEIHLPDAHFGLYAWAPEAGEDWDTDKARDRFLEAVKAHLAWYAEKPVDEILFVIGSDMLHIDNDQNTTTKGTPQDVDTRRARVIEVLLRTLVTSIELCRNRAPTKILGVPGNHDFQSAQWVAMYLDAWFREAEDVTVDASPAPRKYHRYGTNLLGVTHGNEEKHSELPAIMAQEVPQLWAETTCREFHVGHIHRKKQTEFLSVDEKTGVIIRTLSNISPSSAWAKRRGYVSQRAAESYLWSREGGMSGYHRWMPKAG